MKVFPIQIEQKLVERNIRFDDVKKGEWINVVIKYVFQPHGDDRGQLVALEEFKDIPFRIKRVYYMYDTGDWLRRGFHAPKRLQQILICIHGSCKVLLVNGKESSSVRKT